MWYLFSGVLFLVIIILSGKIYLMKKSADEIREKFAEKLETDTNTLIDISSHDKSMRELAKSLNGQLGKLSEERHRFCQGDAELKEAVTNISHDLRTPLTAICGYLDLLEREEVPEDIRKYLDMIENRTEVMKQLTEELFRYSVIASVQEEKKEWVCLNQLLEESIASFYGAIQVRKLMPVITITEKRVERYLDSAAVVRIFGNIMSNAIKYSDGDLEIVMDEDGVIRFSNTAWKLDTVAVGRLFDRFYTVEAGRNSTGLGLSIAKLLTERMGGKIQAEYKEGKLVILVMFL